MCEVKKKASFFLATFENRVPALVGGGFFFSFTLCISCCPQGKERRGFSSICTNGVVHIRITMCENFGSSYKKLLFFSRSCVTYLRFFFSLHAHLISLKHCTEGVESILSKAPPKEGKTTKKKQPSFSFSLAFSGFHFHTPDPRDSIGFVYFFKEKVREGALSVHLS